MVLVDISHLSVEKEPPLRSRRDSVARWRKEELGSVLERQLPVAMDGTRKTAIGGLKGNSSDSPTGHANGPELHGVFERGRTGNGWDDEPGIAEHGPCMEGEEDEEAGGDSGMRDVKVKLVLLHKAFWM